MTKRGVLLVNAFPRAREIWDFELNPSEDIEEIAQSANRKVNWKCKKGHKYSHYPKYIVDHEGKCPYCTGKWAIPGETDFFAERPDLIPSWDEKKNGCVARRDLLPKSTKEFWFICDKGHSHKRSPAHFTDGRGCGICSGRTIQVGVNDLATTHPEFISMWDFEKNDKTPQEVTAGRSYKAWWKCDLGHSWKTQIYNITGNKQGCPVCSNQKILPGFNDVFTLCPDAMKMFDREKTDSSIDPRTLAVGSKVKMWWKCSKGHSWEDPPQKRVKKRTNGTFLAHNCPFCGRKRVANDNNMKYLYPDMAKYFDEKANGVSASEVFPGTSKKMQFRCDSGHTWRAQPNDYKTRIDKGDSIRCPYCVPRRVSNLEMDVLGYVKSILPGKRIVHSDRTVLVNTNLGPRPHELDIYIPELSVAIEFNGVYWHSEKMGRGKWSHFDKWMACQDKGIQLIAVWEDDWRFRRSLVEGMLKHHLGLSCHRDIRKATASKVDPEIARGFFDSHSLDGSLPADYFIGLSDEDGNLVGASSWIKFENNLILIQKEISTPTEDSGREFVDSVIEIARETGCKRVVSFSDNAVSDGLDHLDDGFSFAGFCDPSYKYLVGLDRCDMSEYNISRFKNDPLLKFEDGLTEAQLAELNGLDRVWDYGKKRWVMEV